MLERELGIRQPAPALRASHRRPAGSARARPARRRARARRAGCAVKGCGAMPPRVEMYRISRMERHVAAGSDQVVSRMRITDDSTVGSASIRPIAVSMRCSMVWWVSTMMSVLALALVRLALQHRVDRNVGVGQDPGDVGQHARLVGDPHPQVVGGLASRPPAGSATSRSSSGWNARCGTRFSGSDVSIRVTSTRSATTALAVGSLPAPLPKYMRVADDIALDPDRVHRAFDVGEQAPRRDQRRMDPQFDAGAAALGDAEQLDPVAELLGIADVLAGQVRDPLDVGPLELHRDAEGDRGEDGQPCGRRRCPRCRRSGRPRRSRAPAPAPARRRTAGPCRASPRG